MGKRVEGHFFGQVQGVGFRFYINDLARNLKLTGFVRNLPDGQVELIAEGEEKNLKELLEKIKLNFADNIQDSQIEWQEVTDEFQDFKIKF